jgi:hypothetical protein
MTYRENVDLAAAALVCGHQANWDLARLTYDNTRDHGGRAIQNGRVTMEQWCVDVAAAGRTKFKPATGQLYRRAYEFYISNLHSYEGYPDWTETAYVVAGSSTGQASQRRGLSEARNQTPEIKGQMLTTIASDPSVAPEDRQAAFAVLARDPSIVKHAAELGTPTSQAVSRLTHQVGIVREQRREQASEADPISRRLERQRAALDLEASCNQFAQDCVRFAREITDLLPASGEASPEDLDWIKRAIERGRSALDQLEVYVSTGRSDLDAFLESVLGGKTS